MIKKRNNPAHPNFSPVFVEHASAVPGANVKSKIRNLKSKIEMILFK